MPAMSRTETGGCTKEHLVLVTVGTTHFDALISAVDQPSVADVLAARGYTKLIIQAGSGQYQPHRIFPPNLKHVQLPNGLQAEWLEYTPSLAPLLASAELVISHAGAGSIFEALGRRGGAPWVVAVPNASLMDNHQTELAEKLAAEGHLASATPDTLLNVLQEFDPGGLVAYIPGEGDGMMARIDALCGVGKRN